MANRNESEATEEQKEVGAEQAQHSWRSRRKLKKYNIERGQHDKPAGLVELPSCVHHILRKFHESQVVALLLAGPGVGDPAESKGMQAVVGVEGVAPALNHRLEMLHGMIRCQQFQIEGTVYPLG